MKRFIFGWAILFCCFTQANPNVARKKVAKIVVCAKYAKVSSEAKVYQRFQDLYKNRNQVLDSVVARDFYTKLIDDHRKEVFIKKYAYFSDDHSIPVEKRLSSDDEILQEIDRLMKKGNHINDEILHQSLGHVQNGRRMMVSSDPVELYASVIDCFTARLKTMNIEEKARKASKKIS